MIIHDVTQDEFDKLAELSLLINYKPLQEENGTWSVDLLGHYELLAKYPDDELQHLRFFRIVESD